MKRKIMLLIAITMAIAAGQTVCAANPIEFTKYSRTIEGDGTTLGATGFMKDNSTPFCSIEVDNEKRETTFILLDNRLNEVRRFTIKDCPVNLENHISFMELNYHKSLAETGYGDFMPVTQHFFNDDDLCEFMFQARTDDGRTELHIYNEAGEFLGKIDDGYADTMTVFEGDIYAMDDLNDGEIYVFERGTTNVKAIANKAAKISSYPNPVEYDEDTIVSLPEIENEGCRLNICDMNGRMLVSMNLEPEDRQVSVPGYRFAKGANIITVINADGDVIASGKIICE